MLTNNYFVDIFVYFLYNMYGDIMLEELISNPLFIITLVAIGLFLIGLVIAGTAHQNFYSLLTKLQKEENSTGSYTYEVIEYGIQHNNQKTQLFIAGEKIDDCYDYENDSIILKENVFYGTDIASLAIASHEFGHSMQRYNSNFWFFVCHIFQKLNSFFSGLAFPLIFIGLIVWIIPFELNIIGKVMIYVGLFAFLVSLLLKIFLIPLEFGASKNARKFLKNQIGIKGKELAKVRKLLNAAGMTYVASLFATPYRIYRYIFKGY